MHHFHFCPNPACAYHQHAPKERWFVAAGFYVTKTFGKVQRFRCSFCGKYFSTQTFSLDYFAKRKIAYPQIETLLSSSMSIRALSRFFSASCGTIQNRIDRLARQAIALQSMLRPHAHPHESVCIDGFVSFDVSQYFPNNITLAVTADSQFFLAATHATLRRSGNTTEAQKHRMSLLYRACTFEPRSIERSFRELLDRLAQERMPQLWQPLILITDEKQEYRRALYRHPLFRFQNADHRLVHLTVHSTEPRTWYNPLFGANYMDRELRKDQAAHRRETVCFSRNVANMLNRFCVYMAWHNYAKPFRIKANRKARMTHAEAAGIPRQLVATGRSWMFRERAFVSRLSLDALDQKLWKRAFPTPLKTSAEYLPRY
ncbi:MAG: hypothetical protein CVV51_14855, partial [Spirochaetae bacterium HGW-Spirochaetae-7]